MMCKIDDFKTLSHDYHIIEIKEQVKVFERLCHDLNNWNKALQSDVWDLQVDMGNNVLQYDFFDLQVDMMDLRDQVRDMQETKDDHMALIDTQLMQWLGTPPADAAPNGKGGAPKGRGADVPFAWSTCPVNEMCQERLGHGKGSVDLYGSNGGGDALAMAWWSALGIGKGNGWQM